MSPAYRRPALAPKLIALSPFIAIALVVIFHTGVWFLLIPASAILLGGSRRGQWGTRSLEPPAREPPLPVTSAVWTATSTLCSTGSPVCVPRGRSASSAAA